MGLARTLSRADIAARTTDTFPRVTTASRVSWLATGLPTDAARPSGLPRARLSRQKGTHTSRQAPVLHRDADRLPALHAAAGAGRAPFVTSGLQAARPARRPRC